jgi:hypothetical protein
MLEITTISSDKSERAIKVGTVIYSPDLLEYPKTLDEGVAYLINTKNMSMCWLHGGVGFNGSISSPFCEDFCATCSILQAVHVTR